jgi:hypothetical protein
MFEILAIRLASHLDLLHYFCFQKHTGTHPRGHPTIHLSKSIYNMRYEQLSSSQTRASRLRGGRYYSRNFACQQAVKIFLSSCLRLAKSRCKHEKSNFWTRIKAPKDDVRPSRRFLARSAKVSFNKLRNGLRPSATRLSVFRLFPRSIAAGKDNSNEG